MGVVPLFYCLHCDWTGHTSRYNYTLCILTEIIRINYKNCRLTFTISKHLHSTTEHSPQHTVLFRQGSYGGVEQSSAHIQLDILAGRRFDHCPLFCRLSWHLNRFQLKLRHGFWWLLGYNSFVYQSNRKRQIIHQHAHRQITINRHRKCRHCRRKISKYVVFI